jgi:hypothetical protein
MWAVPKVLNLNGTLIGAVINEPSKIPNIWKVKMKRPLGENLHHFVELLIKIVLLKMQLDFKTLLTFDNIYLPD